MTVQVRINPVRGELPRTRYTITMEVAPADAELVPIAVVLREAKAASAPLVPPDCSSRAHTSPSSSCLAVGAWWHLRRHGGSSGRSVSPAGPSEEKGASNLPIFMIERRFAERKE